MKSTIIIGLSTLLISSTFLSLPINAKLYMFNSTHHISPTGVICDSFHKCEIHSDEDVCRGASIDATEAISLTIVAIGTRSCAQTKITCPEDGKCSIHASGDLSLNQSPISAKLSTSLSVIAHGGDALTQTAVYCPMRSVETCVIRLIANSILAPVGSSI